MATWKTSLCNKKSVIVIFKCKTWNFLNLDLVLLILNKNQQKLSKNNTEQKIKKSVSVLGFIVRCV